jgi:PAS domain S-box-containing protein
MAKALASRPAEPVASILMVDDRPANLLALEAILEPLGQRLVRAESGEQALMRLEESGFAVILMDVRMPGMDGLRVVELIKQREATARIPVILLTAVNLNSSDIVGGYQRGVVDFLLKPFDPEILRTKVAIFVDLYLKEQKIKHQAELLRRREREVFERRSQERFRQLMDALPQLVFVAGPDLRFHYWNNRAADYLGVPASEPLTPEQMFEFVHPDDRAHGQAQWARAVSTGNEAEAPMRVRRRSDGAYRWFQFRALAQRGDSGMISGWIVAANDIDAERHAIEQAELASRMKEEFLAIVSHELRNPLNAIKGWTHLLRSNKLDRPKTAKALETIERNVDLQAALIEDILDVSNIVRGKLNLNVRTIHFAAVIEAALAAVRPAAEARGLVLDYRMEADDDIVSGDADRLQQVCWNLLSNSIKFTERGGRVSIVLRCTADELIMMVRDTGKGISPAFLPFVFERFRQAENATTRVHGGLGLGLAIVRHLVELHGGDVRAESEGENAGATFWVKLPLKANARVTGIEVEPPGNAREKPLRGLKLVVVDDEDDSRELLTEALEGYGAEVRAAANATDALRIVAENPPDLMVSDIAMPQMDGYELIERVRQTVPAVRMPAVALTGLGRGEDQERAIESGFQLCVVKPVSPERLAECVAQLSGRK